jgi:hypothetical protein
MAEYLILVPDDMSDKDRKHLTSIVYLGKEVIRCKDCEFGRMFGDGYDCDADPRNISTWHEADWFCASGMKKGCFED